MIQPETRYTTVGNDSVAYQVLGEGPRDLVFTYGVWTSVDGMWEEPRLAYFARRLAAFCRWISFDRRGSGLSDPRPQDGRSVWEHWIEDLIAVLGAVDSWTPVLLCVEDASLLGLKFADVHSEQCSGLVLFNGTPRVLAAPDYPAGIPPEQYARFEDFIRQTWGKDRWADWNHPSQRENEHFRRWFRHWCRVLASPRAVVENVRESAQMDVREVLPRIRVPALVMTRRNYRTLPVAHGRYLAEHIPSARFVELPGADSWPFLETPDLILEHIEEFLTGARHGAEPDRALVALLFTDIVDSTVQAAKLGDAAWRALLDRHDRTLRDQVKLFGGTVVDHAGDGSLSTFGDSRRAIECALAVKSALNSIGIEIRAGIHFGEVERREDGRLGGVAVHLGARVMDMAAPSEVLVSRTVRDILIGSRYEFGDRGTHELKGVPGQWQLYAVVFP